MEENNVATQKRRLGEILVTSGEITQSQLDQTLAEQKNKWQKTWWDSDQSEFFDWA